MSKAQRDSGARFEREVAKAFGTTRHLRCSYAESAPDIITDDYVIECKYRASIAAVRFLEQCEQHAEDGKTCIVVMKERRGRPVVMLRLEDFLRMKEANCVPNEDK